MLGLPHPKVDHLLISLANKTQLYLTLEEVLLSPTLIIGLMILPLLLVFMQV